MSKMDLEIQGITPENLSRGLGELAKKAPKEFDKLLHQEAETIKSEAVQIAPVRTSALRKSARVDPVRMGYVVGFYTKYAAAVHEMGYGPATKGKMINFRVGGAKYLEKPYRERKKTMVKRFMEHMIKVSMGIVKRNI
tara:strand:- start:106 stop:519 length:414 start_codon:yes stop_codon:yes gene_type:complete